MPISLDRQTFIRPFAHRGLHKADAAVVENSLSAFTAALAKDYAIECDLRPAKGGVPVVFHDAVLDRLVDTTGPVNAHTTKELARLKYKQGGQGIMSFAEILDLVAGRVPLMVEVKNDWNAPNIPFLEQIAALSSAYQGPIVLKSFDPIPMAILKDLAPDIPRGIIAGNYLASGWWNTKLSPWRKFRLTNLAYSGSVKPSFISYRLDDLPNVATWCAHNIFKLPLFTWTVRSTRDRARAAQLADAPIFEGFEP